MGGWKDGDAAPIKEAQPTREINELLQTQQELGEIQVWIEARKSAQVYLTREEAAVCVHAYTHKLRAELMKANQRAKASESREKRVREALEELIETVEDSDIAHPCIDAVLARARRALEGE